MWPDGLGNGATGRTGKVGPYNKISSVDGLNEIFDQAIKLQKKEKGIICTSNFESQLQEIFKIQKW